MKITNLETLIFGVDNIAECAKYLTDYGLADASDPTQGIYRFEALDGTAVELYESTNPSLPPSPAENCLLRKTVMGVYDQETLDAIVDELSKDREVRRLDDGSIESQDDAGFVLGFQISKRKSVNQMAEIVNAPGSPIQRNPNELGVDVNREHIWPRSLSHVVYFVPDVGKLEAFYERLGFRCTDRFEGIGPFLQPAGTLDHHTHFLIEAPAHMQGVEHFTFHFAGPNDVVQNGTRFTEKGYQSFWGPGRHIFGSNWFWYFNSPFACHVEMDADMDLHDGNWEPRVEPLVTDTTQVFLLQYREKWSPSPDGS
jgi:catechol 2,3-dioxygenase-like lactoylglutathione lyase family enzyme